jgi:glycosyltransferase involved in cell wall biosynthesis
MGRDAELQKVAFIGSYLPRRCGIATFTNDLWASVAKQGAADCFVLPVTDRPRTYEYPSEVCFEIDEQDQASYRRAADFLNFSNTDVVSVQHEFGIYGGPSGSHLLMLLRGLRMPVVTTLHTVLKEPNADQRRVMAELSELSARLVVMSESGRAILEESYGVSGEKVRLIPHGIPDMPFVDPAFYKDQYGVEGKHVLLTFGLLSPNKGIEVVINALPEVLKEFPNLVYIVLGATHPNLLREQGEVYRMSLETLVHDLGLEDQVIFYDRFVELDELKQFIGAADLYVTPYLNPAQITSGALAYAFGCGKAVISTPYAHARELLAEDRGVLVPFGSPEAIASEIVKLLRDDPRRHSMRKRAYMLGREMVWDNVAHQYLEAFRDARQARLARVQTKELRHGDGKRRSELPLPKLDHLMRMTDGIGLFQHACFTLPNYVEGYCTDDNARALLFTVLLEEDGEKSAELSRLQSCYSAFVNYAFDAKSRRFRNFMSFDRRWLEDVGSEDSHGRALWALGTCVGRSLRRDLQYWAAGLFAQALGPMAEIGAPRSAAFALLGIHEYTRRLGGDRAASNLALELGERLQRLYANAAAPDWQWFEDGLTYCNAKLPHALIVSGARLERQDWLDTGLKSLAWLMKVQRSERGLFRPIGSNGFYPRGGEPAYYDQQPVEAQASLSACLAAYRVTSDPHWLNQARACFDWYFGKNDLGLAVYDPTSGGCRDALQVDRTNQNQGAESTLSYLLSLVELRLFEATLRAFQRPAERDTVATSFLSDRS